jgi:hypothetical protein
VDPNSRDLTRYLQHGILAVEGWLHRSSAAVIVHLGESQTHLRVRGDVCEIGIHHGKLFLILANLLADGECACAVDIFSDQHKNIDNSGFGDRTIFEANLREHAADARVDIVQQSSLDLDDTDFRDKRFRLFSIDGGHTAGITEHDLWLAQCCMVPGGIVIVDDLLSSSWLGVITGVARFLSKEATLIPFALSPNKLYLTTDDQWSTVYKAILHKKFPLMLEKLNVEFFDFSIDCYGDHPIYYHFDEQVPGIGTNERKSESSSESSDEIKELRTQIEAIMSSTSWRMTAPLRKLANLLRGSP